MASKKYTCGADGYYQTKVWDGTYDQNGRKHRITLRSNKSSRDLERQVAAMKAQIESRNYVRNTDILFIDYSRSWLNVYKSGAPIIPSACMRILLKSTSRLLMR